MACIHFLIRNLRLRKFIKLSHCFYFRHNTEKVIYFLLLERKRKRPAYEDELETMKKSLQSTIIQLEDPPKKRIDICQVSVNSSLKLGQISEGSPLISRRKSRYTILIQ